MKNTVLIYKFSSKEERRFNEFLKRYRSYKIFDIYDELDIQYKMLKDPKIYFAGEQIKNKFKIEIAKKSSGKNKFTLGNWVVFTELSTVYHLLDRYDYLDLRTIRNRDLITLHEQKTLYNKKIVFIGMSVGSQVLLTFVRTGIGNKYIIADADKVELHNLNRTNFILGNLGENKVDAVSRQLNSIDPYVEVRSLCKFVNEKNLKGIVKGADLIVDSFDNFKVKLQLRRLAKRLKIPIISGFDIARGAMVITERYDTDTSLDNSFYLNGFSEKEIFNANKMKVEDKTDLFINIIGRKYHSKRMIESVMRVGKDLTGYPQLAVATNLTSSLWTCAAIDLFLKQRNDSLRVYVDIDKKIYGKLN